jgi:hypothetical protein
MDEPLPSITALVPVDGAVITVVNITTTTINNITVIKILRMKNPLHS